MEPFGRRPLVHVCARGIMPTVLAAISDGLCVRFVHASLALPAVDVTADGADGAFAAEVAYAQTSEYEIVPTGT